MDQTETFLSVVKDTVDQLETLAGCGVYPPVLMRSIITRLSAVSKRGLTVAVATATSAPRANDAYVAVGATRFSDGTIQTAETIAQAQAAEKTKPAAPTEPVKAAEQLKPAAVEPKPEDKKA